MQELETSARDYLASAPFTLLPAEDPNGDLVWRARISRPVPLEWSAIVGDAVHNLRSALDLLAWQLVEVNGVQPSRDTSFPISQSTAGLYEQTLQRALRGAPPKAVRLIRCLRPFGGGNIILGQLRALDITDKHRLVLIVGAAHKHLVIKAKMKVAWQDAPVEFPPLALNPADRQFPLQDGAEVFRICAAARSDALSEHNIVFELAFGDVAEVKGLPLVETLQSMHGYVTRIVKIMDEHFFK
jgi:hypothetical protein